MNPSLPDRYGTAQDRAEVVAGIRALADLLESDPTLPVPQSVDAQHSVFGDLTDEDRVQIREVAQHLGIDPDAPASDPTCLIDETDRIGAHFALTANDRLHPHPRVRYTVYGSVEQGGEQV